MSAHTPHQIEVCLKTLVVYIIKLHIFSNFWSGNIIQTVLEGFRQEQHEFKQESENTGNFSCPLRAEKLNFLPRDLQLLKSLILNLEISSSVKSECVLTLLSESHK